ncbi:MAG TPA: hypothetical protein VFD32_05700 [Dehalococcoidia bacterium]|nr:hypothetical protein [Dehalococcoidia bacterium]
MLVGAAALVGGAPGIIPLVVSQFVNERLALLLIAAGVLWLALQVGCGLCAYRAPRAAVRMSVPVAVAAMMAAAGLTFFPAPLVFFPGSVLWAVVATQSWRDGPPKAVIVDRVREQLRKTFG